MGVEEIKKEEPQEKPPLDMLICMLPNGAFQVSFPLMADKIATYGFLKLAEKTLDKHYIELGKKMVEPARGGIMGFARNRLGGKI